LWFKPATMNLKALH